VKATAKRTDKFEHSVKIRDHQLTVDEPEDVGGDDRGPSPQELLAASLASCTAITMGMYAQRKGWDLGDTEVSCSYTPAERGCPTRFTLVLRFASDLDDETVRKLEVIAAKCPVHRTLEGEVMFEERVERVATAS
jgi:putative redox protein